MGGSGFSGEEVAKAMLNSSVGWYPKSRTGSHIILEWEPPEHHEDSERRTVSIPLNDPLPEGTLRSIADDAEANSYDEFVDWIDRNS
jgi:predicted RNA binding protein YcfA (HicA-like mRNA interferase family)